MAPRAPIRRRTYHTAWRGAETWGFHESPSYPHMYCFLVWMERKNGILYRKDSTLEHYCNRWFSQFRRCFSWMSPISIPTLLKCNQRSARFLSTRRSSERGGNLRFSWIPELSPLLVWMERKNGILYRKDSTLEHYCNRWFSQFRRCFSWMSPISIPTLLQCNQRSARFFQRESH